MPELAGAKLAAAAGARARAAAGYRARGGRRGGETDAGAHSGSAGVVGELGEGLESAGRRWGSTAAGGEDGDGDGSTGRSGLHGSAESFGARRRSSCACRRDEGGDGGCGNGEWRRRQRSGAVRESKGESEGKNEEVDRTGTAPTTSLSASRWQGRGQAGWWRGGARALATRLSDWREDNDDWHWASGPAGLHSAR